ncbi:hypothetical protein PF010_g21894 [Phytophthora fragariae]|uniref:Uncharacterized protein n=1 Tax=Phytophthora fragariae TaxID=53985 RepID=A0A6G0QVK7_9STRA|nr:hypothetical protein PF010_g21894 [Phytophthora fragariae]KAE9192428.1 hypothetical protein PF004_g21311 [Phytophthora fragariae]KAE9305158.1 hypothetical protein PF008_g21788 [Phytophthora fragariae]
MSKRGGMTTAAQAPHPSKPPGSKSIELQRSIRSSHLATSPAQATGSRRDIKTTPSQKSLLSIDDNNSAPNSPHTARDSEPATDDEAHADCTTVNGSAGYGTQFQLETAERQVLAMLNKITKKSERNHRKYDAFRSEISGKDKRIDELHASFEDLACQTAGLEVLCNSNVDVDTLEKLFMTIPLQQRKLYLGE